MQAIMETVFETGYLLFALFTGVFLLIKSKGRTDFIILALAVLILGFGDAFHLIPRMIALNTDGFDTLKASLGIGKLITSITMTFFYVAAYLFLIVKYKKYPPVWLHIVYGLLLMIRIVLVAMPQNDWLNESPYIWNVIRNIPFVAMGIIFIILSYVYCKNDKFFKPTWILVTLSFVFYLITALGATFVPILGLMMLPKTVCYIILFALGIRSSIHESEVNSQEN